MGKSRSGSSSSRESWAAGPGRPYLSGSGTRKRRIWHLSAPRPWRPQRLFRLNEVCAVALGAAPGGGSRSRRSSAPAPSSSRACAGAHGVLGAVRPRERRCSGSGIFAMPGMMLFGRRWAIASDDLVFPGFCELLLRVLW